MTGGQCPAARTGPARTISAGPTQLQITNYQLLPPNFQLPIPNFLPRPLDTPKSRPPCSALMASFHPSRPHEPGSDGAKLCHGAQTRRVVGSWNLVVGSERDGAMRRVIRRVEGCAPRDCRSGTRQAFRRIEMGKLVVGPEENARTRRVVRGWNFEVRSGSLPAAELAKRFDGSPSGGEVGPRLRLVPPAGSRSSAQTSNFGIPNSGASRASAQISKFQLRRLRRLTP